MTSFEQTVSSYLDEFDVKLPDRHIVSGRNSYTVVRISMESTVIELKPVDYFRIFIPMRSVSLIEPSGIFGKRIFKYREGYVGFSPPQEHFSFQFDGKLEGYSILIEKPHMNNACREVLDEKFDDLVWRSVKGDYVPAIYYLALDTASQVTTNFPAGKAFVEKQIDALLSMILRRYSSTENRQTRYVGIRNQPVINAIQIIESNLNKKLTIEKLADVCGASQTNMRRLFRAETGESIGSYIKRKRLEKAARLLKETDQNISSIAKSCGFFDNANFSRQFKTMYRQTPSNFRKGD